jgi:hypothetical protein
VRQEMQRKNQHSVCIEVTAKLAEVWSEDKVVCVLY